MKKISVLVVCLVFRTIQAARVDAAEESAQDLISNTTTQSDMTLIDPEFSNEPIPKLTLPPELPAQVHLPDFVVKDGEWKGSLCGVQEFRTAVFRHADKWASFWERAMAPYSSRLAKTPPVDFGNDMVVGVFLGEKPYPHYEIEIRSIRLENKPVGGQVLRVRYREVKRMMGVFVPPFAVRPFHLKRFAAFAGDVEFVKVKR